MEPTGLGAWGVSVASPRSQKIEPCVLDMLVQKQCKTIRSAELDQLVRFMIRVGFTHPHGVSGFQCT